MKRIMAVVGLMLAIAVSAYADGREYYNHVQVTRNAKELCSGCTAYVIVLDSGNARVITANANRERIMLINISTWTAYVMPCSSWGTSPVLADVQAHGFKLQAYAGTYGAWGDDRWIEDIYTGKFAIATNESNSGINNNLGMKFLVVEYSR